MLAQDFQVVAEVKLVGLAHFTQRITQAGGAVQPPLNSHIKESGIAPEVRAASGDKRQTPRGGLRCFLAGFASDWADRSCLVAQRLGTPIGTGPRSVGHITPHP